MGINWGHNSRSIVLGQLQRRGGEEEEEEKKGNNNQDSNILIRSLEGPQRDTKLSELFRTFIKDIQTIFYPYYLLLLLPFLEI